MDTFGHGGGGGGHGGGGHGGGHSHGGGRGRGRNWYGGGWGPGYVLVDGGYYDDLLDDVLDNYDEEEDADLGRMISG